MPPSPTTLDEHKRDADRLRAENKALREALAQHEAKLRALTTRHETLARSEERFRRLFENMSSGFVLFEAVLDDEGRPVDLIIVAANQEFQATTGLEVSTVLGRRLTEVMPGIEDDEADWIATYGRVATEGTPCRFDDRSDHLGRHYSVWAFQLEPGFCATYFVDISARREAEEHLQHTEELLAQSFRASPLALTVTGGEDHAVVEVNQAFLDLFGVEREEVIGRRAIELDLLTPADRDRVIQAHTLTDGVDHLELVGRRRTGERLDLVAYSRELVSGGPRRQITHLVNVTERNRAAAALVASEARYRTLLDQAPAALLIVSPDQRILEANSLACDLFGYSKEEFAAGVTARHLIDGTHLHQQRAAFRRVFAGERVVVRRTFQRRDGGRFPGELTACLIDRDQILAIVLDLTESEAAEAERRDLERQLHVARRLESIGLLAGGVAHDFNNLLTVILSYTDFVLEQVDRDDPIGDATGEVHKAGLRAAQLTRQLLAFSRKQVLQPVVLDLNRTARELERMLRRILGEHIEYEQLLAPGLSMVRADPGQIEQVIMNLVVNARDAMPQGGRLTVQTSNVVLEEGFLPTKGEIQPGPHVMLAVSDTGTGMEPDQLERIFEPFYTTKEVSRGTGLGLSTVYGIVRQSGGSIRVRSTPGVGTTFEVALAAHSGRIDSPAAPASRAPTHRGAETVLVVEDDAAVRSVVVRTLRRLGYQLLEAANGAAALALAEAHDGAIDLLVTDVVMPKLSGRLLATQLAERRPGLKVLYMSGYLHSSATDPPAQAHGRASSASPHQRRPAGASPARPGAPPPGGLPRSPAPAGTAAGPGPPGPDHRPGELGAQVPLLSKPFGAEELASAVRRALHGS